MASSGDFSLASNQVSSTIDNSIRLPQLPNITRYIPVKLTSKNYLLWKNQFLPILYTHKLMGIVNGSTPTPPKEIVDPSDPSRSIPNPTFERWFQLNQLILNWLISSLTGSIMAQVIGLRSSQEVWNALSKSYSTLSHSRIFQLQRQLQSLRKGTLTVSDYVRHAKSIADNLAVVAEPILPKDLAMYILCSLGSDYKFVVTTVTNRSDMEQLDVDDVLGILLNHEALLEQRSSTVNDHTSPAANVANFKGKNQGSQQNHNTANSPNSGNTRGRGRG
ncbi:PREDICTED: uncharacterized protein LOC104586965 [Nelumbo nucifera]|uniref:Uncharacterized protein LOC104586965 n=1 Tax=Nelumbo nucifera TaxID=4432 RepID=A0A1U8PY68_NELNU|nr:PREDICTED: uncharacterized protein LOC104586965 [Nelumbo nucifera]